MKGKKMKKILLFMLIAVLAQSVFAVEEWNESKKYVTDDKVTYQDLYYNAAWEPAVGLKPDPSNEYGVWRKIEKPSENPIIDSEVTYYINKVDKSITRNMASKITGGTAPYTLTIKKEPTEGTVTSIEDSFTYIPSKSLDNVSSFADSFELKVKDSAGNESEVANVIIELDKWLPEKDYEHNIESDIRSISMNNDPNCWFKYWESNITSENKTELDALKYYVRVRGSHDNDLDLSKISETESSDNPDNVNRVIRLMPKEKFVAMFPKTVSQKEENGFVPGKIFNYLNFLKAVAVMPGYCGDYTDNSTPYIQGELKKDPKFADKIAKKFLATTFAHAVQETSASGGSRSGNWQHADSGFQSKIGGTFAHVKESNCDKAYHNSDGPFAPGEKLNYLTLGNKYYGRGAKQLSYPNNYANTSLLLYGDLRLVKYPNLVEKDILPFLTAITYSLIPKSGNPSIAEVMDGSWSHRWNASTAPYDTKNTYDRDFPLTVLIVNGGPECNGHRTDTPNQTPEEKEASINSVANSKTRIDGYNYFSTSDTLLDPEITYEVETGNGYYEVDKLKINTINYGNKPYNTLFKRHYYYDFKNDSVCGWDTDIQIFGGKPVHDSFKK